MVGILRNILKLLLIRTSIIDFSPTFKITLQFIKYLKFNARYEIRKWCRSNTNIIGINSLLRCIGSIDIV